MKVRAFIQKAVICTNCLRYSHKAENCRSKKRCNRCAALHNSIEEITNCVNPIKCLYCKQKHVTTDIECPERLRQNNIQTIMAKTNLSYVEAKEHFPLLTTNYYNALTEKTEDPLPSESYAKMTANQYTRTNQPKPKEARDKSPKKIIAEQIVVCQDKKRKRDPITDGIALFNKHKVTETEKWKTELRAAATANKQEYEKNMLKSTTKTNISASGSIHETQQKSPKSNIILRVNSAGKITNPITKPV